MASRIQEFPMTQDFPESREIPVTWEFPRLKPFPPISREMGISREFPARDFPLNIPVVGHYSRQRWIGVVNPSTLPCCVHDASASLARCAWSEGFKA